MDREKKVQWSDLPKELWLMIGKRLDNRIDVLRFRSVCKLWRCSVSPFQPTIIPPLPLKFSNSSTITASGAQMQGILFQITFYRMESIGDDEEPNSSKDLKPWLLKLEESDSGELRLLHPITNFPLRYGLNGALKHFNLLDYGIVELRKSYIFNHRSNNFTLDSVNKVVVLDPTNLGGFSVFLIYKGGKLGFLGCGDKKWTHVDGQNCDYDDIIVYKGQCYVVDSFGTISWVNSELKVIQFSPPLFGFGGQKHLVESFGDLYVVDRYTEKVSGSQRDMGLGYADNAQNNDLIFGFRNRTPLDAEAVDFKVYKLDQEWGRWVDVKNLGDRVFILSIDGCFSVSASGFDGVKGNCILFTDQKHAYLRGSRTRNCHSCVFNLEDGSIRNLAAMPGYSRMLQPPSTWLFSDASATLNLAHP